MCILREAVKAKEIEVNKVALRFEGRWTANFKIGLFSARMKCFSDIPVMHTTDSSQYSAHLDFAGVDDIEVVPLVALVNDDLAGDGVDGEHGVEDVHPLILVEMREKHVLPGRLGQRVHCARVFRHDLKQCP